MKQEKTPTPEGSTNINEALRTIEYIKNIINQMGANDVEIPTLNAIEGNLRRSKITPEEAMNQAQKILENKQGYH